MEESNKKFVRCPLCNVVGQQLDDNQLVWYHTTTDNRGAIETHKWSVKTGRMFARKATDDDSVW